MKAERVGEAYIDERVSIRDRIRLAYLTEGRKPLLAAALLIASVFVIVFKIASPARFEVSVTVGGQVVVTAVPLVYGLPDVVAVAVVGVLAGAAAGYLAYVPGDSAVPGSANPSAAQSANTLPDSASTEVTRLVSRLLEGEARTVYLAILEHGGEMLQREVVLETRLPKATVSRTLVRLADRGLIVRTPFGLTNRLTVVRTLDALDQR